MATEYVYTHKSTFFSISKKQFSNRYKYKFAYYFVKTRLCDVVMDKWTLITFSQQLQRHCVC